MRKIFLYKAKLYDLYIEIKGFFTDLAKRKFGLFKQINSGINILLLQEKELKEENII